MPSLLLIFLKSCFKCPLVMINPQTVNQANIFLPKNAGKHYIFEKNTVERKRTNTHYFTTLHCKIHFFFTKYKPKEYRPTSVLNDVRRKTRKCIKKEFECMIFLKSLLMYQIHDNKIVLSMIFHKSSEIGQRQGTSIMIKFLKSCLL